MAASSAPPPSYGYVHNHGCGRDVPVEVIDGDENVLRIRQIGDTFQFIMPRSDIRSASIREIFGPPPDASPHAPRCGSAVWVPCPLAGAWVSAIVISEKGRVLRVRYTNRRDAGFQRHFPNHAVVPVRRCAPA